MELGNLFERYMGSKQIEDQLELNGNKLMFKENGNGYGFVYTNISLRPRSYTKTTFFISSKSCRIILFAEPKKESKSPAT